MDSDDEDEGDSWMRELDFDLLDEETDEEES